YEAMKLRLLNAGHQCLCYFAWLCGYRMVHDAARDPLFAEFLLAYFDSEAMPTLRPVPGIDLTAYSRELVERFANPGVGDTVARLCAYSSDRIPKWLLPVVHDNLAGGGPVRLAAATLAPLAQSQRVRRSAFIENAAMFGNLSRVPRFVQAYRWALDSLHTRGARTTLEVLLHGEGS